MPRKHVVFLLHGIRTQGEWARRAAAVLEQNPEIRARPIRYEFFDVIRFLLPFGTARDRPIRRTITLLRDELSRDPDKLSVIAHSFGTYIIARILEQESDIRFYRVIFAGSIVPDDFDWSRHAHRLGTDVDGDWHALNDCGMRDLWPVLAKSITWGYGSSGRFGFGHVRVKDRFFEVGHSGFFSEDFVEANWKPFLSNGTIAEGTLALPTTPWWVSVLTVLKLRYFALLLLAASLAFSARWAHSLFSGQHSTLVSSDPSLCHMYEPLTNQPSNKLPARPCRPGEFAYFKWVDHGSYPAVDPETGRWPSDLANRALTVQSVDREGTIHWAEANLVRAEGTRRTWQDWPKGTWVEIVANSPSIIAGRSGMLLRRGSLEDPCNPQTNQRRMLELFIPASADQDLHDGVQPEVCYRWVEFDCDAGIPVTLEKNGAPFDICVGSFVEAIRDPR